LAAFGLQESQLPGLGFNTSPQNYQSPDSNFKVPGISNANANSQKPIKMSREEMIKFLSEQ